MRRRVQAGAAAVVGIVTLGVSAPASSAATERGTVTVVRDGDTLDVDTGASTARYRLTGVQAMEVGECHADAATDRLRDLVEGREVTLSAHDPSQLSQGRPLRHVDVGTTDVGLDLVTRGLALAFPHPVNGQRDRAYRLAQASAEASGVRLWDDDACGAGPAAGADLALYVTWDADGDDAADPEGESVEVVHRGGPDVDLGGWQLRDSALNRLTLPSRTLRAGQRLVVTIGDSAPGADLAWGSAEPIFENDTADGAYLLDLDGDVRAHTTYPCLRDCAAPLADLELTMHVDAEGDDRTNADGEWVNLRNVGTATLDLGDLQLVSHPHVLRLPEGTTVTPGSRLRVSVGEAAGSDLQWDRSAGILDNSGDTVLVRDELGTELARAASVCPSACGPLPSVAIAGVTHDPPGSDDANPNAERITIRNTGDVAVDLQDWAVHSPPYWLDLQAPAPLAPGADLVVRVGRGTDDASTRHWGKDAAILGNGGDQVALLTPHRDVVDCVDWGSSDGDCPARAEAAVERVGDDDAVATAVALSRWGFEQADVAVLARADAYPDALGGGALAVEVRAPVLLTGSSSLDGRVRDELARLGAEHVYVLGGPAALSERVVDDLADAGLGVTRLAGDDRFATAIEIADELERLAGPPDTYVLATSHAFPDALVAGNLAVAHSAPVLLTTPGELHPLAADRLGGSDDVLVVGGPVAVADAVVAAADARAATVRRLAGDDRYRTAIAVVEERLDTGPRGRGWVVVTGERFADAVAAAPAAAERGAVLVLGHPIPDHPSARALAGLRDLAPSAVTVTATGSTAAMPTVVPAQLLSP